MIEIKNLTKTFGDTQALKDVSIKVNNNSVIGLLGSNGAGKSTLMRILIGIYQPSSGEVTIDGSNPFENINIKSQCFFIADNPKFLRGATMEIMAKYFRGLYSEKWNEEKFQHLASLFSLNINSKISKMSKGMQHLAAVALGLATRPKYLLLDEVFEGLDPVMRKLVKELLIELVAGEGTTIVFSSHNLREIDELCDSICILHKGAVVLNQDAYQLKEKHFRVKVIFNNEQDFDKLNQHFDLSKIVRDGKTAQFAVVGEEENLNFILSGAQPIYYEIFPMTLEEIFIFRMEELGYEYKTIL